MRVNGRNYRTIWLDPEDDSTVHIIDQRALPHRFDVEPLRSVDEMATAIKDMHVRGAGLIGAAAAYGMYLAAREAPAGAPISVLHEAASKLKSTRPTAVNLAWAVERQMAAISGSSKVGETVSPLRNEALSIADEDAANCRRIGTHGVSLIEAISAKKQGGRVNILTHCNAGWLAFVDYGTATAPMYEANQRGLDIHVWVDETRPRNQGAKLTAWELQQEGVPHTVIADNTGGHLMQHEKVDLILVGSDRTTREGDVANKIGTYLKALAAHDNGIPFYVALPSSTIDWTMRNGITEIPIEERGGEELRYMDGWCEGESRSVLVTPPESPVANFGFDVTPHRLVTGLITERGICAASEEGLLELYPERLESPV